MKTPLFDELKSAAPLLSVSIVSADLMHLAEAEERLSSAGVRMLHFDIMDGRFCPQLTTGPFFVKGIASRCFKDVHLMMDDPLPFIPDFAKAGADIITVHVESGRHVHRALQSISEQANVNDPERGILRGVALNPGTPVSSIEPLLDDIDCVIVLAINPGFPGQCFIPSTIERCRSIRKMAENADRNILLCIDGGINSTTIVHAAEAGADFVVSGSAVFKNNTIEENYQLLTDTLIQGK
jgi:ribulose-phosphate 3-epimerase